MRCARTHGDGSLTIPMDTVHKRKLDVSGLTPQTKSLESLRQKVRAGI